VTFAVAANEQLEGQDTAEWVEHLLIDGLPESAIAPGEDPTLRPEEVAVLARSGAALRWVADALEGRGIEFVQGSDPRSWMSSQLGHALADLIAYRAGPDHPSTQTHLAESACTSFDTLDSSPVAGLSAVVRESDVDDPAALFAAIAEAVPDADQEQGWVDDRAVLLATWGSFLDWTPAAERNYPNLQLHVARTQRGEPTAPGVRLLTVHKSQGREFRAVSVIGLNDGQFPDFRQTAEKQRRAELHCFYVAVTRASRALRLSRAMQRMGRNGPWDATESPFLSLARSALKD
jgi:ATP-dependent exoDNAse (exonuclease V) beta subunit